MKIEELMDEKGAIEQSEDVDIKLTQFTDDNVSAEMEELLDDLSKAESFFHVRAILNRYMPELNDGTVITPDN